MLSRRAEGINSQQCGQYQVKRAKAAKAYHATPSENSTFDSQNHPQAITARKRAHNLC
jgi:hypothetical protein